MALKIDIFSARSDNYGYLLHDEATGRTAALDAPELDPILAALARTGWLLTDIFITHHHSDHVEAIRPLKERFDIAVTGPRAEKDRIEGLDTFVAGGDTVWLGETALSVIDTPGHTLGHVCYHDAAGGHLFSADALFSLGVGRMFEGTPGPMWQGLLRLRELPDDTRIYCGHEYTLANARFALSVDSDNAALRQRAAEAEAQIADGRPTVPSRLGNEKAANPFLRADDPALAERLGLPGADPAAVFAALRRAKDEF